MSHSLNPSILFFHCVLCLDERQNNISPAEFAKISTGVSENGDLVVWCLRHDSAMLIVKQGEIDKTLLDLVGGPCGGCGQTHSKDEETKH